MDYDYFKSIHGKDAGSLYYENSYITNENVYVYRDSKGMDYAVFSVIDVLLAIGYEIEWENDYVAKLTYDGVEYCLDVEKQCIFNDESYTFFGFLVGGSSDYYMKEKQLYINIYQMHFMMSKTKTKLNFDIDVETKIVNITRDPGDGSVEHK